MNKMREIRIEKIVLNIGCGTTAKIEAAQHILAKISNKKAVITKTRRRTTFNVPKDNAIGCKVTIRDGKEEMLRKLLSAKDNVLSETSFDSTGNFSFGIKEYIDIPGVEYDIKIGIIGLEAAVTLERPGFRIKKRRLRKTKIPTRHLISKEESMDFMKEKLNIKIV